MDFEGSCLRMNVVEGEDDDSGGCDNEGGCWKMKVEEVVLLKEVVVDGRGC